MRSDDELDPLRAAWERLEAPGADRPLEEPDEATRAALEWVRAAWAGLEPPPARVPAPARGMLDEERVPRPARARPPAPLVGALAALLAALAAAGLWAGLEHPAREGTETVVGVLTGPIAEQGPSGGGGRPDPAASTGATEQADGTDETSPAAREDGPSGAVQVAALSAGHMELRSGPVRLILLTDTARAKGVRERDDG